MSTRQSRSQARARAAAKAAGRCIEPRCPNQAVPGKSRCEPCGVRHAERSAADYARRAPQILARQRARRQAKAAAVRALVDEESARHAVTCHTSRGTCGSF